MFSCVSEPRGVYSNLFRGKTWECDLPREHSYQFSVRGFNPNDPPSVYTPV